MNGLLMAANLWLARNNLVKRHPAPTAGQPSMDFIGAITSMLVAGMLGGGGTLGVKHVLGQVQRSGLQEGASSGLLRNVLVGGTAAGGAGSFWGYNRCQDKLIKITEDHEEARVTWNSTLLQLNSYHDKVSVEKEKRFDEQIVSLGTHLNETRSSLRDLQQRHQQQYANFVGTVIGLLLVVLGLFIVGLYQNLSHNRERHKLAVAHHLQCENSLKDKLQQQQQTMQEQKETLKGAIEEQKRQQQLQFHAPHHMHGGQPLILTLPSSRLPSPSKQSTHRI